MWHELFIALALVFVIEGILPFIAPATLRRLLLEVTRQDDRQLRFAGLTSMVSGVVLLYLIN
ncbi:DUF2065 domain-containing protein [Rhodoferax sp. 4810]|uniref:DUF2065 domain-containing protein n=1 Tax=Thiospirillum jenense TaxID=1653858 RepID=A0A839HAA4_9GAMM|nr:DUF2065 domain-containing protein [Thiospirillum jenense]MBB1076151.1 DUF2065 domain-containing protein [Rhodoferax jenense]MBB1126063.1 DUF2065 domain-containing protein [Thiospirillum jenense]